MRRASWDVRFLDKYSPLLRQKFREAEDLSEIYPGSSLVVLRLFCELLLDEIARQHGVAPRAKKEAANDFTKRLVRVGLIPPDKFDQFTQVREVGNKAVHEPGGEDPALAREILEIVKSLVFWFDGASAIPAGEFAPEQKIGVAVHAIRDRDHLVLWTKIRGRWELPTCRLLPGIEPKLAAAQFARGLVGNSFTLRGPIGATTRLKTDFEVGTDMTRFEADVIDESHFRPVLICFQAPGSSEHREYEEQIRMLAISRGGQFKLAFMDLEESSQLANVLHVHSAPAVALSVEGKCVDVRVGIRPIAELASVLDHYGVHEERKPSAGRVKTTYFIAHSDFVEPDLINKRSEILMHWLPIRGIYDLPVADHAVPATFAAMEVLLREMRLAVASERNLADPQWFKEIH